MLFRVAVILLLVHGARTQGTKTWCETQRVYMGQTAAITCRFDKDLNKTNIDFAVKMYRDVSGTPKEENVLDCFWVNEITVQCKTAPGYFFNQSVTDSLTIIINETSEAFVGTYRCLVEPSDPNDITGCKFTLEPGVRPRPFTTASTTESSTQEAGLAGSGKEDQPAEGSGNVAGTVILVILGIIIVCVVVAVYVFRAKIQKRFPNFPLFRICQHPPADGVEGKTSEEVVIFLGDGEALLGETSTDTLEKDRSGDEHEKKTLTAMASADKRTSKEDDHSDDENYVDAFEDLSRKVQNDKTSMESTCHGHSEIRGESEIMDSEKEEGIQDTLENTQEDAKEDVPERTPFSTRVTKVADETVQKENLKKEEAIQASTELKRPFGEMNHAARDADQGGEDDNNLKDHSNVDDSNKEEGEKNYQQRSRKVKDVIVISTDCGHDESIDV